LDKLSKSKSVLHHKFVMEGHFCPFWHPLNLITVTILNKNMKIMIMMTPVTVILSLFLVSKITFLSLSAVIIFVVSVVVNVTNHQSNFHFVLHLALFASIATL